MQLLSNCCQTAPSNDWYEETQICSRCLEPCVYQDEEEFKIWSESEYNDEG